jgi:transaldolase
VAATTTRGGEDEEIRPLDNRMRKPIRAARAPSAKHLRLSRESARLVRRSRFRLHIARGEEIRMKLFVDTGNIKEVETLAALGILDGVTTNPTLLSKEAGDYREILKTICQIVKGPVSGEVVATDYAGMLREGHDLAKIDEHIIVKVPLTRDGITACKTLASEAIRVNVTLVFSPAQALLAAKAGATFVSPFIGRLDDVASSGMSVVRDIVEIFGNYDFTTEVLVASCRHPMHIVEAARIGADICTSPAAVIDALFNHPLTNIGLERFIKDWEKAHAENA